MLPLFIFLECIPGPDFLCQNLRCVPGYLQCDGLDHCGDDSDEPTTCYQGIQKSKISMSRFKNKHSHY